MSVLKNVRASRSKLKADGKSEHANAQVIEDLAERAQKLIADMNVAKLAAMREAEKPFLEELQQIDEEMALFITLLGS